MPSNNTFNRLLNLPLNLNQSAFIFGPRGTGKTAWLKKNFPDAIYFDLLSAETYNALLASPNELGKHIPEGFTGWIIIDEIQKVPILLNEVHRLIESNDYRFILTGSSARSLRRKGVNLLGGRALEFRMHPLIVQEVGEAFSLESALQFGTLPAAFFVNDPQHYLETYIASYLKEEVQQEGVVRNLGNFTRFLQIASFSQGEVMNYSQIARDAAVSRKVVEGYFGIVEDLLIGFTLPVFNKHAKRRLVSHSKFYYFDVGLYRALRPKGPLDSPEQIDGPALETIFISHLKALNDYYRLGYTFYFWRTTHGTEVDFIAYGEKGLIAFEIKRKKILHSKDLNGLESFRKDYPIAQCFLIYGGEHKQYHKAVTVLPIVNALSELKSILDSNA